MERLESYDHSLCRNSHHYRVHVNVCVYKILGKQKLAIICSNICNLCSIYTKLYQLNILLWVVDFIIITMIDVPMNLVRPFFLHSGLSRIATLLNFNLLSSVTSLIYVQDESVLHTVMYLFKFLDFTPVQRFSNRKAEVFYGRFS